MSKLAKLLSIAVVTLGLSLIAAIAQEVPTFDVRKNCKADVQAYSAAESTAACLKDEQNARETLVGQWTQLAKDDRARCTQMVGDIAGSQSYVELLTCLQMAKDAKTLPKN